MGKGLVAVVVIILLLGGVYVFYEYEKRAALQNCEIMLSNVRVESIGLTGATLEVVFRIYNPNDVTATLDRIDYELYGNGEFLGYGYVDRSVDIPAHSIRYVSSEFTLDYGGALKALWSALKSGDVEWRVKGTVHIDTPIGTLDIPFEERTS
ncbi:LEA type 2 family protein [Thermococcus sp. GR4]|uniref:LEA type 2 family protein n=1 Tax=Thermococcus sp. GR4 TaxID=1638254 RepID=UPI001431CED3|nr:LEA type 2 family protein [Thermococcus sp. GR4]NJE79436.1 hypothetical protein [Thermococcus sp. GR4]